MAKIFFKQFKMVKKRVQFNSSRTNYEIYVLAYFLKYDIKPFLNFVLGSSMVINLV